MLRARWHGCSLPTAPFAKAMRPKQRSDLMQWLQWYRRRAGACLCGVHASVPEDFLENLSKEVEAFRCFTLKSKLSLRPPSANEQTCG